jgi:hypothetical protein
VSTRSRYLFLCMHPILHSSDEASAEAVRRELRMRTMFNLLGPLTNPARASGQVVGVYALDLVEKLAEALSMLGLHRALVVHGLDGLDEITITATTRVAEAREGSVRSYEVEPEEFGLAVHQICHTRRAPKGVQPLQQFGSVGVVAELFQAGHLRANGNLLPEHLHLRRAVLDGEAARAWRLESDEQHKILGIGQAQHQVMQDASAGTMPLEEMMITGDFMLLIFLESSWVTSK